MLNIARAFHSSNIVFESIPREHWGICTSSQNPSQYKSGFPFTNSHFHFTIVESATAQILLHGPKQMTWSISKTMPPHTAQQGHNGCCTLFTWKFWTIHLIIWAPGAKTGRSQGQFANSSKCTSRIYTAPGCETPASVIGDGVEKWHLSGMNELHVTLKDC
jgi:hypothetical protein